MATKIKKLSFGILISFISISNLIGCSDVTVQEFELAKKKCESHGGLKSYSDSCLSSNTSWLGECVCNDGTVIESGGRTPIPEILPETK